MRVDKGTDEFLDRTGERQFLNLVFAAILIVLNVVGRQAQLGDMHVGRIFAIRRIQLVLILFLAMPQHQIDGRIAGGEVLGIGLSLGMMQVEPGVGEEQIISGRDPAMGTQRSSRVLLIGGAPPPACGCNGMRSLITQRNGCQILSSGCFSTITRTPYKTCLSKGVATPLMLPHLPACELPAPRASAPCTRLARPETSPDDP